MTAVWFLCHPAEFAVAFLADSQHDIRGTAGRELLADGFEEKKISKDL